MDTLFSRYRNVMLLVAVLFLQLVMLAFQVKRPAAPRYGMNDGAGTYREVPLIRVWAVNIITPIEKISSGAVRGVVEVWHNYIDLRGARRENLQLSEEVNRLKLRSYQLQDEALEARRLKTLLEFKEQSPSRTIAARVIGSSASETSRVLFIDRGSESGIRRNMAVITPEGIVGKTYSVFHGSSQVLVITDPESGAGALLPDSRVQGILRGAGGFFCQLRYIVNEEKVSPGDRVFTSGEDMIYPKGLPIGVVTSAKLGSLYKEIMVQPAARLNRLEEVLVVLEGVSQEIPPKPESQAAAEEANPAPAPGPAAKPASETAAPAAATPPKPKEPRVMPVAAGETDADRVVEALRQKKAAGATGARPAGAAGAALATAGQQPPAAGAAPPAGAAKKPAPVTDGVLPASGQKPEAATTLPAAAAPGAVKKTAVPGTTAPPTDAAPSKPADAAKKTPAPGTPPPDPSSPAVKKNPSGPPNPPPEVQPR